MKMGWGWKITILYSCFAVMIASLAIASSRQKFDLVSDNYYNDEIAYQKVLDASKNQSVLADALLIHSDAHTVYVDFPAQLSGQAIKGDIKFYSPVNEEWDVNLKIAAVGNRMLVPRILLKNTVYTIKINYFVADKNYYQESKITLHD